MRRILPSYNRMEIHNRISGIYISVGGLMQTKRVYYSFFFFFVGWNVRFYDDYWNQCCKVIRTKIGSTVLRTLWEVYARGILSLKRAPEGTQKGLGQTKFTRVNLTYLSRVCFRNSRLTGSPWYVCTFIVLLNFTLTIR